MSSLTKSIMDFPVLGLDFSDLSIKFASFNERGSHLGVRYIGAAELHEGVLVNGKIEDASSLIHVLRNLKTVDGKMVRGKFVVASLPEEKGFIQLMRVARAKAGNLAAAIRWEMEGAVPLPVEELYYDFEVVPTSEESDHVDVLVLAYPRVLVDSYAAVLKEAGFVVMALELESQAIVRALVPPAMVTPLLVIDLGATRTSLALVAGGSIVHTSTISISGHMFEESIAKSAGVSLEEAHRLKIEIGLDFKQTEGVAARALLESLRPLVDEVLRHIDFYRNHSHDRGIHQDSIEKIILTGGDANLVGLDSFLSRSVKVDVEKWNPFTLILPRMGKALPPIPANIAHEYTTAIGLALREIDFS
ncbi:MAG: hypothetical protein A3H71_00925 [Candidatus Sungbacteria bacterium RIFCSPLOWO2_02_FULL_48_13b]|uniref:SHS2 domain-containing protein n=2 Tax=Candidatus Sungiibacteriota TaxID=1817917 RepID=A0A1G2LJA4_9BACT|nr:MAG: hypothetical protein A3C12_00715 [Candidatus Sungbacteria bacterium RIFCSPHIGHO2_02_FULL_49_20]OHA11717.1 MAG: hypothetical protein A3H71_00925 [Candidatus Sungbacteria bacterium RIFCSPLOWO2_02_FULL_48_13b]